MENRALNVMIKLVLTRLHRSFQLQNPARKTLFFSTLRIQLEKKEEAKSRLNLHQPSSHTFKLVVAHFTKSEDCEGVKWLKTLSQCCLVEWIHNFYSSQLSTRTLHTLFFGTEKYIMCEVVVWTRAYCGGTMVWQYQWWCASGKNVGRKCFPSQLACYFSWWKKEEKRRREEKYDEKKSRIQKEDPSVQKCTDLCLMMMTRMMMLVN